METLRRSSARFVEDIYPRQLLYALTIRSPSARGRLISVECPKIPGSYTLITASGIPGENRLEDTGMPILAKDELSYIGEPAALLVGPDKAKLEEYAAQCRVVTAEEPPLFRVREAEGGTDSARRELSLGDGAAAFSKAAAVVRGEYHTGIQDHWYAEPAGAVAVFEQGEDGTDGGAVSAAVGGENAGKKSGRTLAVYTATQWPFHVKRSVARMLGQGCPALRVEGTESGLHLDGKLWYPSLVSCHAALGAWITKKPVRLMLTREEDFRYSPKRCASEISVSSALNDAGGITAAEIEVLVNLGAYGVNSAEILDQTCLGSLGVYQCEAVKVSGRAVKTNIPPQGPLSGFGLAQGAFAVERHVSRIADLRKQDPSEWRRNNLLRSAVLPPGLVIKQAIPGEQLLDCVEAASGYRRKWASYELLRQSRRRRCEKIASEGGERAADAEWAERGETPRGIGIALGWQGSGLLYAGDASLARKTDRGVYSVELTLEKDGGLAVSTSMAGIDSDYERIWAALAAEILSIDPGAVRLVRGDDQDSGPACASRNITALTKLVQQACLSIRKQRFRDPLPITVRRNAKPQKTSAWEERLPPPEGKSLDAGGFARPGWAAAVVEAEIDPVEYTPLIRGVWLCVDGGRILSEDCARRSLKNAAVQALGWAYRERAAYCSGELTREQFELYDIPNPGQIPPVQIDFLQSGSDEPKGVGELPFSCVPAAFLQAVSQAMDHHFLSIPLGREEIWEAGKLKKAEASAA